MVNKIWIIGGKLYKTESGFNKEIEFLSKHGIDADYQVYEVVETGKTLAINQQLKRDEKLKTILGEIPQTDIDLKNNIKDFLFNMNRAYRENPSDDFKWIVESLNRNTDDKLFVRKLKNYKNRLFKLSNGSEYFLSMLKVHNFRSLPKSLDESYHKAFREAKLELKKEKPTR